MTTLTAFQNAATEAIWNKLEDANEGNGMFAAMKIRLGGLGDFMARYFAQDEDVQGTITVLTKVTNALGWDYEALVEEACEINIFDTIDQVVKEDMEGNDDDANAVQNMIAEQHWVALTAELNHLATTNEGEAADLMGRLAYVMENTTGRILNALYA